MKSEELHRVVCRLDERSVESLRALSRTQRRSLGAQGAVLIQQALSNLAPTNTAVKPQ